MSRDVTPAELFAGLDARLAAIERVTEHLVTRNAQPNGGQTLRNVVAEVERNIVVPGRAEIQVEQVLDERAEYLALSHQLENIAAHWRDLVLTPSRTESMLFAILPALNVILEQVMASTCDDCIKLSPAVTRALRSWGESTVAERVSLSELFDWVAMQLQSEESVVPAAIRSNLEAARGD